MQQDTIERARNDAFLFRAFRDGKANNMSIIMLIAGLIRVLGGSWLCLWTLQA